MTDATNNARHEHYMQAALTQAHYAAEQGEVPVGAVVVCHDEVIGRGYNQPISSHDPSAHAEIMAVRHAAQNIGNYRLSDATLYVTLEPCTMCLGALIHARIDTLVYGAKEPKSGVICSQNSLHLSPYFNHKITVIGDVLSESCSDVLSQFFKQRRENARAQKTQQKAHD